jgi:hypothetical protein
MVWQNDRHTFRRRRLAVLARCQLSDLLGVKGSQRLCAIQSGGIDPAKDFRML